MPFGHERVAATYAKEILRSVNGSELAKNAVVDGTTVPLNADGRRILETGTVMVYTASGDPTSKVKPSPASGIVAADVAGIVETTTEFWPGSDLSSIDDKPLALFTSNCDFAVDKLIGYSGNAAAVKTAMSGGGTGRCGNCTFS